MDRENIEKREGGRRKESTYSIRYTKELHVKLAHSAITFTDGSKIMTSKQANKRTYKPINNCVRHELSSHPTITRPIPISCSRVPKPGCVVPAVLGHTPKGPPPFSNIRGGGGEGRGRGG